MPEWRDCETCGAIACVYDMGGKRECNRCKYPEWEVEIFDRPSLAEVAAYDRQIALRITEYEKTNFWPIAGEMFNALPEAKRIEISDRVKNLLTKSGAISEDGVLLIGNEEEC